MKRKLVFGLMGCGEISVQTAKAVSQAANCEIGMVQDTNEEMARDLSEKFHAPYCLTWDELLSNRALDAIYIATPHYLHAEGAIKSAQAGKHVLVEKPISTTLADTLAMISAAEQARVTLSVALTARNSSKAAIIKRVIDDNAIGKVVGLDFGAYAYKPESYWTSGWTGRVSTNWRASKAKSGGGFFIMNLIHTVDLLRYVTGLEAQSVAAFCDTFKTSVEVEDYIVAIIRYDNGAIGQARGATFVEGKVPPGGVEGDRIIGLAGQIYISPESVNLYVSRPYKEYAPARWHSIPAENPWGGREQFVEDYAKAILAGKTPPVTGLDGLKALEVCLAVYRSAETGSLVRLPMTV